jgi:hypothetical protein
LGSIEALPDLFLQMKFIWDVETVLDRATTAATLMDLRVRRRHDNGFVAGSQWWGAYELSIHAKTVFRTTLTVGASTLKLGYQDTLRERAQLFIDLARDPKNRHGPKNETIQIEERRPTRSYENWWDFLPDDDNSEVVTPQTELAMQEVRGNLAWESLRRRTEAMGLAMPRGNWDALSEVVSEALSAAPETLPINVQTPKDIEDWYAFLRTQWQAIPDMRDSLDEAMNRNRQLNAKWFQDNGYGGH